MTSLGAAPTEIKHLVANDILNDILETAMDIADGHGQPKSTHLEDLLDETLKISLTPRPSTVIAQDNLGIGDTSAITFEPQPILQKPSKPVEKKTRITDLIMNSSKALSNLLNEEQRRKQNEWEETHEHVIQVIELQGDPEVLDPLCPENFPLPYDEDEEELLMPKEPAKMDTIDLATEDAAAGNSLGGTGDEKKPPKGNNSKTRTLTRLSSFLHTGAKRKRWFSGFMFCNFRRQRKHREEAKEQETAPEEGTAQVVCE